MSEVNPGAAENAPPEYATTHAGTQLLLIRHGETEWNRDRRIQGQTDVPLSDLGREQARRLSVRLAHQPIQVIYSSDLKRATETAVPIAQALGLPIRTSPLLREVNFGDWEGLTVSEIADQWPEEYAAWRRDSIRHRPPGGEHIEELQQRSLACATEILTAHAGEIIAVVAHGGSVRATICGLMGFPLDLWRRLRIDNTSISRLVIAPLGPTLVVYNDTCHLD